MKTYAITQPAYPNAASARQIFAKLVDTLLVAAMGAGLAAMVLLLLVL